MPTKSFCNISWQVVVTLIFFLFPSLLQLLLRMSKPPVLTAAKWAGPMSFRHGDHSSTPSPFPRSATGCSRAPSGGTIAPRMSCRECWELRRRAASTPINLLLPVPPQTTWDPQGLLHGRSTCSCLRLASRYNVLLRALPLDRARLAVPPGSSLNAKLS